MSLTKEEYLSILSSIALNYDAEYVNECHDDFCISMRNNIKKIKNLIEEHFELVDLLKKHDLENLSIEELDGWLGKLLWHVDKVNELSNKLFELSRDIKSKDEMIDELKKTINENIYKIFKNQPLKFEELKPNMWVWDNKTKSYIFIFKTLNWEPIKGLRYANMIIYHSVEGYYMDFEENRFYRYEVKK